MLTLERRSAGEIGSDGRKLVGYAAVYGPLSEDLGGFRERVDPSAFSRALQSGSDVRALVDHDSSKVLGRVSSGTLRLASDKRGLRVEIDPPATSYAMDLRELMTRGDVSQMSFGFLVRPGGETWSEEDTGRVRTLLDLDLVEVSIVTIPAYPDTSVALRSYSRLCDSHSSRARKLYLLRQSCTPILYPKR